jgi:hypothetical protein
MLKVPVPAPVTPPKDIWKSCALVLQPQFRRLISLIFHNSMVSENDAKHVFAKKQAPAKMRLSTAFGNQQLDIDEQPYTEYQ